ncbi:MAG TPA: hypothetical protein VJR46_03405 [Candidatus Dormibacteraeota bacterium]|nr:hypothetical protein [Candidatus Dormibacteraeota bacterium]
MQARLVLQQPSRGLALIALFAGAAATLLLGLQLGLTFKAPSIVQAPSKVIVVPASQDVTDQCYMVRHNVC